MRGALTPYPIKLQAAKGGSSWTRRTWFQGTRFQFTRDGKILAEADKKTTGLGDFCLRILAHLGTVGWISNDAAGQHSKQFTMLVHQLEAGELSELLKATHNPA